MSKPAKTSPKIPDKKSGDPQIRFAKSFKHWRSGKILKAEDYGHKCWPIRCKAK